MKTRLFLGTIFLFILCLILAAGCSSGGDDDDSGGGDDCVTGDDTSADDTASDDTAADDTTADDDTAADDDSVFWPGHLLPGPDEPGYNADLEALARMYDREFHVFNAAGMGLNADVAIPLDATDDRELVRAFLQETDGWDFEAYSGKAVFDVVTEYQDAVGLYGGVGIAADAYRYGVLRDQGYSADEVDLARQHVLAALETLHVATAITGVPGVIARSVRRLDIPTNSPNPETIPLFDQDGNPLPPEKNNGVTRADNSGGLYPNWVWQDSCSRDMYIGWCAGFAGAWEVIKDDASFPDDVKARMKEDARQIGLQLKIVRDSGFDLEIPDADGRTTYHGYMNENNYDRHYIPFLPIKDGMYAAMALGSVAALNYVAQDPELTSYLYDTLIGERALDQIVRDNQIGIDLWVQTNYSSINMMFMGAWLAVRYLDDEAARENVKWSLHYKMYDKPGWPRQPAEIKQSLFDFQYAGGEAGATAWHDMTLVPEPTALANGIETLMEFKTPPFWEIGVVNCDADEITAGHCVCVDGVTELDLLGYVGRGDKLVSAQPVPMAVRPPSNFYWRSNPYEVNSDPGESNRLLGGVDFRYAYWLGRWTR